LAAREDERRHASGWQTSLASQRAGPPPSRHDRGPRSAADLALKLYRDPDLRRAELDTATPPDHADHADRAAISIDDPAQGPFPSVTRSGHC
jgi:hypothetical protein